MPDPDAALHVPARVLARDLFRGQWLATALAAALWTASAAPLLVTDALPLVLWGKAAVAVVSGPGTERSLPRFTLVDLPLAWQADGGGRLSAVVTGLTSPPVGATVPILYPPDAPYRASRMPWLFRFLVVLPVAAGLWLGLLGLRQARQRRVRVARVRAMLADGRRETVRVTKVRVRGGTVALSWQADDGRQGERLYGPGAAAIQPGSGIVLWLSADGGEIWDDAQVQALWGRFRG